MAGGEGGFERLGLDVELLLLSHSGAVARRRRVDSVSRGRGLDLVGRLVYPHAPRAHGLCARAARVVVTTVGHVVVGFGDGLMGRRSRRRGILTRIGN